MSVLLRLLLCLGLILNGSAYAVASTQMQLAHMTVAMDAAAITPSSCHDGMDMTGMDLSGMDMSGMDHAAMTMPAGHGDHDSSSDSASEPDCCKSQTCDCSCVQPVPATAIAFALGGVHIGHGPVARPISVDHDAPSLPYPIRPPIV